MKYARHFLAGMALALPALAFSNTDTAWVSPVQFPEQALRTASCIVLKGDCANQEQALYHLLAKHPHAVTLIYENNPFRMPDYSVSTLTKIRGLKFINCPNLDAELSLLCFAGSPGLKELSLPVDLQQIPVAELAQFKALQTLQLHDRYAKKSRPDESLFYLEKGLWSNGPLAFNISSDQPLSIPGFRKLCEGLKTSLNKPYYTARHQTVSPPIPQLDLPFLGLRMDAAESAVLLSPRGSSLSIPERAFVYADGRPVAGMVTVYFREMQNPLDCILSGIPMTYDSAGTRYDFETGGMFEIAALQGTQALLLAPEKSLSITMPAKDSSNFNFYAYDDARGNWNVLGQAPDIQLGYANVEATTNAVATYWKIYNSQDHRFYDTTRFQDRFYSPYYRYTVFQEESDAQLQRSNISKTYIGERTRSGNRRYSTVTNLIKVNGMKKNRAGDVTFRLDNYSYVHPELYPFRHNIRWRADDLSSLEDLKKVFNNARRFSDIRLIAQGEGYILHLKNDTQIVTLNVTPLRLNKDHKLETIGNRQNANMEKRYMQSLARKEKVFNRKLKVKREENNTSNYITVKDSSLRKLFCYQEVAALMDNQEKTMQRQDWHRYVLQEKDKMANGEAAQIALYRTFEVNQLGIFNCDRVIGAPKETIFVQYINEDQKRMPVVKSYVVNDQINGVITAGNIDALYLAPISLTIPLTGNTFVLNVHPNNTISFLSSAMLKKGLSSRENTLRLTPLELPADALSRNDLGFLFSY